jgi:hypothetical protein
VAFAGILLNHETRCVREFVELDESAARAGKILDARASSSWPRAGLVGAGLVE